MSDIRDRPHSHIISINSAGDQYANMIVESPLDAAIAYVGVANQILRPQAVVSAEDAYNALIHKGGFGCGTSKLLILLSECEGDCTSPVWN